LRIQPVSFLKKLRQSTETSFFVSTLRKILTSQQMGTEKKGKTIAIRVKMIMMIMMMMMMVTVTCSWYFSQ